MTYKRDTVRHKIREMCYLWLRKSTRLLEYSMDDSKRDAISTPLIPCLSNSKGPSCRQPITRTRHLGVGDRELTDMREFSTYIGSVTGFQGKLDLNFLFLNRSLLFLNHKKYFFYVAASGPAPLTD